MGDGGGAAGELGENQVVQERKLMEPRELEDVHEFGQRRVPLRQPIHQALTQEASLERVAPARTGEGPYLFDAEANFMLEILLLE